MSQTTSIDAALARNSIGVPGLMSRILGAVMPLGVAAGLIPAAFAITEQTSIPLGFAITTVVVAIFLSGFLAMSKRIINCGPIYAYVAQGLSRPIAGGTAFVAWAAYNLLQIALYGIFGATLSEYLAANVGWELDWWLVALAGWLITALLGVSRIQISSTVLAVLVTAELIVLWILGFSGLTTPAGGEGVFSTLFSGNLWSAVFMGVFTGGMFASLLIGSLGTVGAEQAAVYSEEARDPQRTVKRASRWSLGMMGATYVVVSLAMVINVGPDNVVAVAAEAGPGLLFGMAPNTFWGDVASVLFITSLFAAMIVFHNAVGRYTLALGREGVIPRVFAATGAKSDAPWVASITQSGLALAVIIVIAITGVDPVNVFFFVGGTTGGLGVLILMALASAAVVGYFWRRPEVSESLWKRLIAPGLSAVLLSAIVIGTTANFATLAGTQPGDLLNIVLPGLFVLFFAAGLGWTLIVKSTRPEVYAGIGYGHEAGQPHATDNLPVTTSTTPSREKAGV